MRLFNNRWTGSRSAWAPVPLPPELDSYSGVTPFRVVLDRRVGTEVGLFIVDRTPFVREIAKLNPLHLDVASGLAPCAPGPVLFIFYSLSQAGRTERLVSFENTINPHDPAMMQLHFELAKQTHWHVFVVGPGNEELNWYEVENVFGLDSTLEQAVSVLDEYPCRDFNAAKADFQARYAFIDP